MTLNRSSYWTTANGERLRVKHMTIAQIHSAMYYLERMKIDEVGVDPYIVQRICENSDCCPVYQEPEYKKDGFFLEDWHDLFHSETVKRLKLVTGQRLRSTSIPKKPNVLVKLLNFW